MSEVIYKTEKNKWPLIKHRLNFKWIVISTNGTTCMETGGRVMQGVIAEESYQAGEDKISPFVEMTNTCHSEQWEESCLVTEARISPIVS